MGERRALIMGNWKMFGRKADLGELPAMAEAAAQAAARADVVVCPPFTLLALAAESLRGRPLMVGAQDCHGAASGAHTGDIAAEMIADLGARFVILGHSERRQDHGETDALIQAKAKGALRAGLAPVICVGESLDDREAGRAEEVVRRQMRGSLPNDADERLAIAYEPIWAIGTGRTPSLGQIEAVHAAIREALVQRFGAGAGGMRVLYGGSVKPGNAEEILRVPCVDGALVGGASLKAADFAAIIAASP